jgi:hypothetical protein
MDMANAIMAEKPKLRPCDLTQHVGSGFCNQNLYQWIPVEVSRDPSDENRYRRTIKIRK